MIIWLLAGFYALMLYRPREIWDFFAVHQIGEFEVVQAYMILVGIVWWFGLISEGKRPLGNIFTLGLFLVMLSMTASVLNSPYTNIFTNRPYYMWIGFTIFYIFLMTSVKTERDLKIVVTGLIIAFFLFMGDSFRHFLLGTAVRRGIGFEAGIMGFAGQNANAVGMIAALALPFVIPMLALCKKFWHYLFVLGYALLALRVLMLTGSRTSFVMVVALLFFVAAFSRNRLKLLPLLLVVGMVGWVVIPNDIRNRYRTIWQEDVEEMSAAHVRIAQGTDRGLGRAINLENWSNYPIFGVGPGRCGVARGLPDQARYRAHSLYSQITGERGTVGTLAFLFLLLCFCINHHNIWKNYKYLQEKKLAQEGRYCWCVSVGVMYAILLLLIQGVAEDNGHSEFWLWLGAFQALAAMFMQEKVADAKQGKLVPEMPSMKG